MAVLKKVIKVQKVHFDTQKSSGKLHWSYLVQRAQCVVFRNRIADSWVYSKTDGNAQT